MKCLKIFSLCLVVLALVQCAPKKADKSVKAVNPKISSEAQRLLDFIYEIQGKHVITGQHNYLGHMSRYTDSIHSITGKYPGIWGGDYGFADSAWDHDNIAYRYLLVPEIIKQHERGSIITLTYHQADPFVGEPCPFVGGVQTNPTQEQWNQIITNGTEANRVWLEYIDRLAEELKELQSANIPVLFRPYHEMNGSWFWWGGFKGKNGFAKLWQMMYDRYTHHHGLNNLIWVWSPDKPWHGLKEYYPGDDFVDIVSLDIYPERDTAVVYRQEWYDEIKNLAGTRPFAIGECSTIPTLEEMEQQSGYAWFMSWSELTLKDNSIKKLIEVYNSDKCLTADEVLKMRGY